MMDANKANPNMHCIICVASVAAELGLKYTYGEPTTAYWIVTNYTW